MVPGGVSIRRLTDDRIRHGGDNSYGKDADREICPSPCLLESYGRQAEAYGPQGDGPRCLLYDQASPPVVSHTFLTGSQSLSARSSASVRTTSIGNSPSSSG